MSPEPRPADESRLLQLVYHGYVAGSWVAARIPERVAYGLAHFFGHVGARVSKKRTQVERNLERITGLRPGSRAMKRLVIDAYTSYARYWLETFRLVRENRDFFLERFRAVGNDNIDAMLARGRGAIVVVGHLGNWDAAGAWVGATGRRLVTVAEVLRPRRMFDFFADHRARLGMTIYPAETGVTAQLLDEVETGAVIAILGDRDLKGTGIKVEFFGATTTFPGGPASLALRSGIPPMVAGVYSERLPDGRRGWLADIGEPIELPSERGPGDIARLTQEIARRLEELVARQPEEWHVFQPFWLSDRTRR